jgi:hypothetical protein
MGSFFDDGYLVPNREQRASAEASHAANAHRDLIARMPQMGAKLLRIQHHDRTSDELEKLDRQTQFETGLTGTPYATGRSIYADNNLKITIG